MARFHPKELREYLERLGRRPIKALSQNFLIDGNILNKIVELAQVSQDDLVVEIGPGPGALTERLLETGCQVIAVEKDIVFANALKEMQHPRLTVIQGDALEYDLRPHLTKRAKLVANLPYNITTPILERFLVQEELFSLLVVMVQDEVAKRLTHPASSKEYVAFTLFLHYYARPSYGFTVSPSCFYPAPRIYSAVMRLDLEKRYPVDDEARFFSYVNAAFSERRKMLRATLKPLKIEQALSLIHKPPTSRPEDLSIEEWVRLYKIL